MKTDTPRPILLKNYRPPSYLIGSVNLDVALHKTRTRVRSRLKLRANPSVAKPGPLRLDGELLELESIRLNGHPLTKHDGYTLGEKELVVHAPPRGTFELDTVTYCNPDANKALTGLYVSKGIYCTQCEAQGFRRIAYFIDRPDVLATYTVRLEADRAEAPVLLANGNPVERGTLDGGARHYAVWRDPHPKPSYLFALVGGNLASIASDFTTASNRKVDLRIYVEPGKESRCAWAMDCLKRSMRWDEERFGREYDLDVFNIVAVSDFNMGAMENKGLNVFNDKYILASPETATDGDYAGIEAVIAHEYFHNWTGDRITCRDWFQLCLKEGLTVFRDQEFTADERSRPVKRIADVRALKSAQFTEDAGPLAHPVRPETYHEINNFYTATVYQKGAEVVRMLKTLLGARGFRAGMDLYFTRCDGKAATVEDFLGCFADANGIDLSQFKLWYSQAGTPELALRGSFDAAHARYRLEVRQMVPPTPGQSAKRPMLIPLAFGLLGKDGRDLALVSASGNKISDGLLRISAAEETFVFDGIREQPIPSFNRGFSAPIKLVSNLGEDDLVFIAGHDSDPFNRFDAASTLAMRHLVAATAALRARRKPPSPDALISSLARSLDDNRLDPAFVAQVIAVPSESDIAHEIGNDVDPDAVLAARKALKRTLGAALAAHSEKIYRRLSPRAPYSPDAAGAGRRALKNACLDLIAAAGSAPGVEQAFRQFRDADNMTDRFAALATLSTHDVAEREQAFDEFQQRFGEDALVMDKWLALQAQIAEPGALDRVRMLMRHPGFSLANPNRVRALIGSFAAGNPSQFNRQDGEGYAFLAEIALKLDAKNPQVAARLLSCFKSWRALEPIRRAAAEAELKRLAAAALSADSRDIVGRALA